MARVGAAFVFALETAMRAGEIARIRSEHVLARHLHVPASNYGLERDVPLSREKCAGSTGSVRISGAPPIRSVN